MAGEYPEDLPDLSAITFAESGEEDVTIIPTALREDGFHTPVGAEAGTIELAAWANWWRREVGRAIRSIGGGVPRRYPTLAAGIAGTVPGEIFRVEPSDGIALPRLNNWLSIDTGGAPASWCTDGLNVYIGYAAFVYAYSAATGLLVWSTAELDENVEHICTDGGRVFVAYGDGAVGKIVEMLDCATGEQIDAITLAALLWEHATFPMACNGEYLVCGGEIGTATGAMVIDYTDAAFGDASAYTWEVGGVAETTWVHAVAVGADRFAICGIKNSSNRILDTVRLSDHTRIASLTDAGWGTVPTFSALAIDGDRIFATGTAGDFTAIGADYCWEFPLYQDAGIKVGWLRTEWSQTINGACIMGPGIRAFSVDTSALIVDDGGFPLGTLAGVTGLIKPQSFDGLNLWAHDTTGTDHLRAYALNLAPRLFRRASDLDPSRRAPGMLAQPVR